MPRAVKIGNEGENLAQTIKFELSQELRNADVFLHMQIGYYADVVELGKDRVFAPTRTNTQTPGRFNAYLEAYAEGDMVWKSDVFFLHVGSLPQDGEIIEQIYPTAFEEALKAVAALTDITVAAETLPPGSNATVRLEKNENGESVLVYGLPQGEQGVSPTVDVQPIDNGHRITVTDAEGVKTFDVSYGEVSEILTNRVKALEQDMAEVKKITDNFDLFVPKFANTAEGETLVLTDSAEGALQGLKVYGKTTQVTTTGKNLAMPFTTQTKNGITLTANADGSFTLDGTATSGTTFQTAAFSLPIGTYTLSLDHAPNVSDNNLYFSVENQNALMLSFVPGANVKLVKTGENSQEAPRLMIYANRGATINNYTAKLQLEAGSVGTEWEPYTGGIPSPSPDYPQPLNSVGDDGAVDVTVAGANLITFPYVSASKTAYGLTYTVNADGSVSIKGTATEASQFVFVSAGTTFADLGVTGAATLSCVTRGTLGFVFGDGTSINVEPSIPSVTITPNGKTFRIRWLSRAGVTYDETIYPMLNLGNVALPYEPYKAPQTLTLSTPNGLPSVGDVYDEIDLERGVYVQRIGRIASYAGESVGNVWMSTTGELTTGATIIYPLATPIETQLSAEEIAAYKALTTHYPTTTIYNDESAHMSVKYAADTKNYIDQHLAALAAAMVNNL